MKSFLHVSDIGPLDAALAEAAQVKATPFAWQNLGKNKTIILIFFNSSLRTRLSSQKAALNLGMNAIVLNVNGDSWKLETEMGVVMDGDKPEHLREAIPVIGSYCDLIGVRSFAGLKDRGFDYGETILRQFIEYSGKPVISLESGTVHPCQAFADLITIEEYRTKKRPKVVLTWAPHPRALPQAVPNSFAEWMNAADVDLVITHPEGYELDPQFTVGARIEYDQMKAFEGADFVYAKNWAAYSDPYYGQNLEKVAVAGGKVGPKGFPALELPELGLYEEDWRSWTVGARQMAVTRDAHFMHCLPVRRNMIVTDDVIEGPRSLVIPEAANREISAETVIKRILESECQ